MSAQDRNGEFDHGTEHKAQTKKRHKKETFTTRGGTNIHCVHCDTPVSIMGTKRNRTTGEMEPHKIDTWDYRDKAGMKAAWEKHKADNP